MPSFIMFQNDFPFIDICYVLRGVLKAEDKNRLWVLVRTCLGEASAPTNYVLSQNKKISQFFN